MWYRCTRLLPPDVKFQVHDLSVFLMRSALHKLYTTVTLKPNHCIITQRTVLVCVWGGGGGVILNMCEINSLISMRNFNSTMPQCLINSPNQMHRVYMSTTLPINLFTKWDNPIWYIWYRYLSVECMFNRKIMAIPQHLNWVRQRA